MRWMKEGVEEYFSASSVVAAIKKLLDNFSLFNFFVADLVKNFKYYLSARTCRGRHKSNLISISLIQTEDSFIQLDCL